MVVVEDLKQILLVSLDQPLLCACELCCFYRSASGNLGPELELLDTVQI